jgi:hypothetical protein
VGVIIIISTCAAFLTEQLGIGLLLGHEVVQLRRVQIGPIKLGELRVGKWRVLTPAEVRSLLPKSVS